jgi:hypothetical protein
MEEEDEESKELRHHLATFPSRLACYLLLFTKPHALFPAGTVCCTFVLRETKSIFRISQTHDSKNFCKTRPFLTRVCVDSEMCLRAKDKGGLGSVLTQIK